MVGLHYDNTENGWTKNYIRPQESGYKTDVRSIKLTEAGGFGLEVEGLQALSFSAMPQITEDFDEGSVKKNRHVTDIHKRPFIMLQVDYRHRGVGGDNSWGAQTHDEYRLTDKMYRYGYVIRAIGE